MVEHMRRQRIRLGLTLLCAGAAGVCAVPAAGAHATFSGSVCSMLSSSQVSALHATGTCTPRTLKGSTSTAAYGVWAGSGARLSVTIVTWGSAKKLAAAEKTLKSLPGDVEPVKGIGSLAYESVLPNAIAVNFVKGTNIVSVQLVSATGSVATGPFTSAAKTIARKV
jgi:hypothetical protein